MKIKRRKIFEIYATDNKDCEMPFVLLLLQCLTARAKKKSLRKEIESEMKKEMKINTFDNCRDT